MSKAPRATGRSLADLIDDAAEAPPITAEIDTTSSNRVGAAPQSSDDGGKPVTYFVTTRDRRRLRQIAFDKETSLHEIHREAVSEWLERRGHPPLEPQAANRQSTRHKQK